MKPDINCIKLFSVFKHRFVITDCDEYVLKYLEAHSDQYPSTTIASIREKHGRPSPKVVGE